MTDDWLIWQLADSAFPTGSFAHSGGLEAAWQCGRVARGESLSSFITASLTQTGRGLLHFVIAVHREPTRFVELDELCDAFQSNHVINRASRAQGKALLLAANRIFDNSALASFQSIARQSESPCHLAPLSGIISSAMQMAEEQAGRLFLFCSLRSLISSAVRLGIVGPMEAQALQITQYKRAQELVDDAIALPHQDAAMTAPILDIMQGMQDRLYSRLFQS